MPGLPDNWEWDYDGKRWFYRYKPTGLIQFTFPKPGDEFPEFVDDFGGGIPDLEPEERLVSQQQVKKRNSLLSEAQPKSTFAPAPVFAPVQAPAPTPAPAPAPQRDRAASGAVSESDDGGTPFWLQPDGLMYMGPGAYNDISPLQEEEEERQLGHDKSGEKVTETPTTVTAATPSTINTPLSVAAATATATVTANASPGSARSQASVPASTSARGTPLTASSVPAVETPELDSAVVIAEPSELPAATTATASSVVPAEAEPAEIPLLDGRPVTRDPVGFVAELASEATAPCAEDLNPAPVELPSHDTMVHNTDPISYLNAFELAPVELPLTEARPSLAPTGNVADGKGKPSALGGLGASGAAKQETEQDRKAQQAVQELMKRPYTPSGQNSPPKPVQAFSPPPPLLGSRPGTPGTPNLFQPYNPAKHAVLGPAAAVPPSSTSPPPGGLAHHPSVLQPARGRPVLRNQTPPRSQNASPSRTYQPPAYQQRRDLQQDIDETVQLLSNAVSATPPPSLTPGPPSTANRPPVSRTSTVPTNSPGSVPPHVNARPQMPPSVASEPVVHTLHGVANAPNVPNGPNGPGTQNAPSAPSAPTPAPPLAIGFSGPLPPSGADVPPPLNLSRKSPPPPSQAGAGAGVSVPLSLPEAVASVFAPGNTDAPPLGAPPAAVPAPVVGAGVSVPLSLPEAVASVFAPENANLPPVGAPAGVPAGVPPAVAGAGAGAGGVAPAVVTASVVTRPRGNTQVNGSASVVAGQGLPRPAGPAQTSGFPIVEAAPAQVSMQNPPIFPGSSIAAQPVGPAGGLGPVVEVQTGVQPEQPPAASLPVPAVQSSHLVVHPQPQLHNSTITPQAPTPRTPSPVSQAPSPPTQANTLVPAAPGAEAGNRTSMPPPAPPPKDTPPRVGNTAPAAQAQAAQATPPRYTIPVGYHPLASHPVNGARSSPPRPKLPTAATAPPQTPPVAPQNYQTPPQFMTPGSIQGPQPPRAASVPVPMQTPAQIVPGQGGPVPTPPQLSQNPPASQNGLQNLGPGGGTFSPPPPAGLQRGAPIHPAIPPAGHPVVNHPGAPETAPPQMQQMFAPPGMGPDVPQPVHMQQQQHPQQQGQHQQPQPQPQQQQQQQQQGQPQQFQPQQQQPQNQQQQQLQQQQQQQQPLPGGPQLGMFPQQPGAPHMMPPSQGPAGGYVMPQQPPQQQPQQHPQQQQFAPNPQHPHPHPHPQHPHFAQPARPKEEKGWFGRLWGSDSPKKPITVSAPLPNTFQKGAPFPQQQMPFGFPGAQPLNQGPPSGPPGPQQGPPQGPPLGPQQPIQSGSQPGSRPGSQGQPPFGQTPGGGPLPAYLMVQQQQQQQQAGKMGQPGQPGQPGQLGQLGQQQPGPPQQQHQPHQQPPQQPLQFQLHQQPNPQQQQQQPQPQQQPHQQQPLMWHAVNNSNANSNGNSPPAQIQNPQFPSVRPNSGTPAPPPDVMQGIKKQEQRLSLQGQRLSFQPGQRLSLQGQPPPQLQPPQQQQPHLQQQQQPQQKLLQPAGQGGGLVKRLSKAPLPAASAYDGAGWGDDDLSKQPYSTSQTTPNKPPNPPTPPSASPSNPPPPPQAKLQTRLQTLLTRLPKPLQPYAARLRGAPITHIVAFLVLHELTAVIPLVGLFVGFHYTETGGRVVPTLLGYFQGAASAAGTGTTAVGEGGDGVRKGEEGKSEMELAEEKFARWFRRRGWFGFGKEEGETQGNQEGRTQGGQEGEGGQGQGARVLVEVGLAYVLTKALLPVRIVVSVWATPWFAGVLGGLRRLVK
ncbi:uncharacterized protein C8A04DRAFT_25040 [Dichotomopilus funicola]|uniref:WW domain-containing protein n=1 Tax=Dichotomopilus funicola TaxID=1934379 RepID=A0AAN6VA81_9PEZI|nr:hypothetical protein C8A04DRAFT_25040 [Dichotomopilus funicola]